MDLKSDCSTLELVEDNEPAQNAILRVDGDTVEDKPAAADHESKDNGNDDRNRRLATVETDKSDALTADNHVKGTAEVVQPMHSPLAAVKSPAASASPTTKGYGLKKWRRIKRDFVKDATVTMDSGKILLKRGAGSSNPDPSKPQHRASPEVEQNSGTPPGPMNMLKNASVSPEFMMHSLNSDSIFAVGPAFAFTTDSENSEDRSSKSSTAASMPKVRYDPPAVLGYIHEKHEMKNLSGNTMANSSQSVQQGKGRAESSKKARGVRVKIEKENSHSSMESDSRSSNFIFMQGPISSVTSNGNKYGNPVNYDGENSDEAHEDEHQISEEVQTAYRKENSGVIEELSPDDLAAGLSWEDKDEKSENHQPSPDQDPLVQSIFALQSVQEALENELQKLGDIGKEPLHDGSVSINGVHVDSTFADAEIHETSSSESDHLASEKLTKCTSGSLGTQIFTLTQKVKYLESKLEEARVVLRAKESRISELESQKGSRSQKEESSTAELRLDKYREMELDLEGLFQQKMESEIEFLVLTNEVEKLKDAVFEEQTSLVGEQEHMLNKLGEVESKAVSLKKQAEELEKHQGNVLDVEEVLKMRGRVCKVMSCFFTQLVLLVLVFLFLILHLSNHSGVVVPT